jgi:hypothetical protein
VRYRRVLLPVVALAAACVAPAEPLTPASLTLAAPVRASLLDRLQAHDRAPSPDELVALAPAASLSDALASIVEDAQAPALARNRALAALAHFPSPRATLTLRNMEKNAATPYARRLATRALRAP